MFFLLFIIFYTVSSLNVTIDNNLQGSQIENNYNSFIHIFQSNPKIKDLIIDLNSSIQLQSELFLDSYQVIIK